MTAVLLVSGLCLLLGGIVAVGFGVPYKEFSLGSTLILTGVIAACTGMTMLGFWSAVRELKRIALELRTGTPGEVRAGSLTSVGDAAESQTEPGGTLFGRDQPIRWCGVPARHPRPSGRSGAMRRRPVIANAAMSKPVSRRMLRQRRSHGAIFCFHPHRAESASAPGPIDRTISIGTGVRSFRFFAGEPRGSRSKRFGGGGRLARSNAGRRFSTAATPWTGAVFLCERTVRTRQ